MNIVHAGNRYQIYGEEVSTSYKLYRGFYEVNFSQMSGFYLTSRPDLETNEEKIYGDHSYRVDKVFNSFKLIDRNFGVILSGQKGIGKSLLARMLAKRAYEEYMPVILVNIALPGIADFLASINQEAMVVFDEFEKVFGKQPDMPDLQEQLLPLFDGLDGGKKLFVITCNDLSKVNSYMLNRPGRFHYHFNISYPSDAEIKQYMYDKLKQDYWPQIDRVVQFAQTINLTYDYLRAICFELNQGYSLEECMSDLNISQSDDVAFDAILTFENGVTYCAYSVHMNLARPDHSASRWFYGPVGKRIYLDYNENDIVIQNGKMVIPGDKLNARIDDEELWQLSEEEEKTKREEFAKIKPRNLIFKKVNYQTVARLAV